MKNYNQERLHQGLSYQPPAEVHFAGFSWRIVAQKFGLFCLCRGLDHGVTRIQPSFTLRKRDAWGKCGRSSFVYAGPDCLRRGSV